MIIGEYTISEIFDGQKGEQGVSVSKVVTEWTKSTSPTQLPSNPTWSETKPSITSGEYLWYRDRTDLNNGTSTYSNAVCDVTISGLVFDVDNINGQITNKIWQSDIATSINQYDNSTVNTLRDRVTTTETNISGVTTRVSDVETSVTNEANKRKAIYGTCSTNADTAAKVVTCQNFELYAGAEISVKFTNTNSTANPTLNVNGTGAKPIKSFTGGNLSASEYGWMAEGVYNFVYDGNNWRLVDNGTVARITSAESSITQNADNINLKVSKDSVISEINQSSESITISADKVNIEGATIFSTGRLSQTSLNNAYDAKGSAATAKTEAINSANSATDTKLQSYSTTSQMNTAIGTAVNNAVDDIEANAIKSTVSCYYRSTTNTTPTIIKNTSIGTSNNTDNAWEYVMPVPKRNAYFFTCEKYTYMDDSVAFSTVRPLDSQTYASKWVSSSDNTYVDGGRIYTHSITTSQLATDAIKSNNYQASPNTNSPYSATGSFLDLSTGNFYTPNFGIDNTYGKAYLNGEIIADSGQIGSDSTNYWEIGTKTDYNTNDSAAIIGHGSSYIQSGGWMISSDRIDTRSYDANRKYTYLNNNNAYWDFGLHVPSLTSNEVYDNNFIYIRNHENTIPTLEGNWNYLFRVDRDGGIEATGLKINGTTIQDMITAGVDGGAYLPTSGGTISGNLTVTGTINGLKTLSVNGKTYNGTADVNVGVIGAAYGGTGQSSLLNSANALLAALPNWTATPTDSTYFIRKDTAGSDTYGKATFSTLWTYIKGKINADTDLYTDKFVSKTGGEFTGAITVSDSFTADEATVGNLIVNGAGRFTNGLYGDLTGNADTATIAGKVADAGNGHEITLNYSGTNYSSTSWFAAWNGYQIGAISPANVLKTIGAQPAGSYVSKTGDTMTGDLTFNSEKGIKYVMPRKKADGEGWAYSPIQMVGNDNSTFGEIGAYGTNDELAWIYIGNGTFNSSNNLRIYPDGTVSATTFSGALSGNASSATKFNSNRTISLTGDVTGSVSSDGSSGWSIATTVNYLTPTPTSVLNTQEAIDNFLTANKFQYGLFKTAEQNNIEFESYDGMILSIPWSSTSYGAQLAIDDLTTGNMKFRGRSSSTWGDWRTIIHDGNYTTYTVQKDGTGATGTWTISISGNASSASKLNSTRSFTIGKTAKNVDWSGAVSFTKAEISDDASSTENGWMSTDDKKKLDSITVSDIGTIGANSIRGEKDIKVTISSGIATIGHENAAITAGTISGTATSTLTNGGSFKIPSITYDAYGHITATGQTTITLPSITTITGNAGTATAFSSNASVTLTGDTTGTASSTKGWSVTTTTKKLTTLGRMTSADLSMGSIDYRSKLTTMLASSSMTTNKPGDDGYILNFGWDTDVGWGSQLYLSHTTNPHIKIRAGAGSNGTTTWGTWRTVLDENNYNSYSPSLTGTGASGTWGISITGSASSLSSAPNNTTTFLRGDNTWTNSLGDSISISKAGECGIEVNNTQTTNPNRVAFIVGGSGNGGIYSRKHEKWIVYSDANGNVVLNGNATTATTSTYAYNLLAYSDNEVTIGANNSTAGASTNDNVWFNYRDIQNGSTSNNATKLVHYHFGNRKGAVTGVQVHADTFVGNATTATKATQDGDGNTIASTYLKLSGGTMTGAINLPRDKMSINFRPDNTSYCSGLVYGTAGNEALALSTKNAITSFMVVHGSDPSAWTNTTWQTASPTIQTKNKSLYVNERINNGVTPTYNFKVNGTSYLGGNVRISDTNTDTASCELQFNPTLDCLEFIFN